MTEDLENKGGGSKINNKSKKASSSNIKEKQKLMARALFSGLSEDKDKAEKLGSMALTRAGQMTWEMTFEKLIVR